MRCNGDKEVEPGVSFTCTSSVFGLDVGPWFGQMYWVWFQENVWVFYTYSWTTTLENCETVLHYTLQ